MGNDGCNYRNLHKIYYDLLYRLFWWQFVMENENKLKGQEIQYEPFTKKKMLQRVEEDETSYCNDDPLAIAKGLEMDF